MVMEALRQSEKPLSGRCVRASGDYNDGSMRLDIP
jgi:hypothetical protein